MRVLWFLIFICYTTLVFFLPNNYIVFAFAIANIIASIACKLFCKNRHKSDFSLLKVLVTTLKILPFVLFTFAINCLLDNVYNASFIGLKLIIVCNITATYAYCVNSMDVAKIIQGLCAPLKLFKINTDEIFILVCISLSMLPILRKELSDIRSSCRARNISFNVKNSKFILSKFFLSLIRRVNELEEALIAKGYEF